MHQQTDLFFYRFRFLFVGILTIAFFVSISALITAIGSHTILDARTSSAASIIGTSVPTDTPNAVTDGLSRLGDGTKLVMYTAGTTLYGGCRSITNVTAESGRSIVHGSAVIVRGVGSGVAFAAHGVGSSIMFTLHAVGSGVMFTIRAPVRIVGSVTHVHASAIIQPTSDKTIPVISSETTATILASLNVQQRQQITDWQAAQAVANRGLGGSIIAGDPNHGGYPAKWDNARQDGQIDSWGMYNRECVSYAAWKVYQTYGDMPYWGGVGNANQWVRDAKKAGIPTGAAPQVHSVAISMYGYYGHAMWVEAVKGNMIYVSQYNYDLHGHYSEMWVNASSFTYIYFK